MSHGSRHLGRIGRDKLRVRVVGEHSFAWVEASMLWGATLEVYVRGRVDLPKTTREAFSLPLLVTREEALELAPVDSPWDGVVFGTVLDRGDSELLVEVARAWRPLALLVATPGNWTRQTFRELLEGKLRGPGLKTSRFMQVHSEVGGVTESQWRMLYVCREETRGRRPVMKVSDYPRTLQTSLDDTLGGRGKTGRTFEVRPANSDLPLLAIGQVLHKGGRTSLVYDGKGRGPDLHTLSHNDRYFWVLAQTIYSRKDPVVRSVAYHELLAIWDYEGKQESRRWGVRLRNWVLKARLASPPAKIV